MTRSRAALWSLWALCFALLALELALAHGMPSRASPWVRAQTAVAGFVLSLFSLVAGVATFAVRETFALRPIRRGELDPETPAGFAHVRATLLALWALCLLIGLLGDLLAYGAASPRAAWPYWGAAAALLVIHAPRRHLLTRPAPEPESP